MSVCVCVWVCGCVGVCVCVWQIGGRGGRESWRDQDESWLATNPKMYSVEVTLVGRPASAPHPTPTEESADTHHDHILRGQDESENGPHVAFELVSR
jgi:hypothetical protein